MKTILCSLMLIGVVCATRAQEQPMPLYPNGIPNAKPTPKTYVETINKDWITKVSVPTITPYLPAAGTANGTAVVVYPGGAYAGLASWHEGRDIARAFASFGVTAFVVKYRLPSDSIMVDKTIGPLQDAQQAVIWVRRNASKYGVKADKVGIIGFSAGGHLASTEGTHFDKVLVDDKDKISARPDFMMLIYPVISFGPQAHVGSRENLVGKTPGADLINLYSNEKQVTANTPPTFLVHAEDDDVVPVQNSLMFYEALLAAKVKAEMHLFEEGGHGFGMNNSKNTGKWMDWAKEWMVENKFVSPPAP